MVAAIPYALAGGQGRADALKNLTGLTWDELLARVPGIGSFLAEVQRVLDSYEMASGIFVMAISFQL